MKTTYISILVLVLTLLFAQGCVIRHNNRTKRESNNLELSHIEKDKTGDASVGGMVQNASCRDL